MSPPPWVYKWWPVNSVTSHIFRKFFGSKLCLSHLWFIVFCRPVTCKHIDYKLFISYVEASESKVFLNHSNVLKCHCPAKRSKDFLQFCSPQKAHLSGLRVRDSLHISRTDMLVKLCITNFTDPSTYRLPCRKPSVPSCLSKWRRQHGGGNLDKGDNAAGYSAFPENLTERASKATCKLVLHQQRCSEKGKNNVVCGYRLILIISINMFYEHGRKSKSETLSERMQETYCNKICLGSMGRGHIPHYFNSLKKKMTLY